MKTLKLRLFFCLMLVSISFVVLNACSKENDDTSKDDDLTGQPVTINGLLDESAIQVKEILALSSNNKYKKVSIINKSFSIELDNGKPWGLIFLGDANEPLGLLSLGSGIESIPLHYTTKTINSINLDTISKNGENFIPNHNPIGNEIPLNSDQITLIAGQDDYLVSLLKNPDVDGNGQIDVLEGKLFALKVIYFIKPGNFKVPATTPTLNTSTLIEGYRLFLTVEDNNYPETIYFTGPAGSPLQNTPSEGYLSFSDARVYNTPYLFDINGLASYIPQSGIYKIKYENSTLTFTLPDQSYVNSNIVFPWPTISLNENGTLNKVDWSYKIPGGAASFDVSALIRNIMVQLGGIGAECKAIPNQNGLYGSDRLPITKTSHIFACQDIVWGITLPAPGAHYVERLMMTYEDHYGASYVVMYEKEYQ